MVLNVNIIKLTECNFKT